MPDARTARRTVLQRVWAEAQNAVCIADATGTVYVYTIHGWRTFEQVQHEYAKEAESQQQEIAKQQEQQEQAIAAAEQQKKQRNEATANSIRTAMADAGKQDTRNEMFRLAVYNPTNFKLDQAAGKIEYFTQ